MCCQLYSSSLDLQANGLVRIYRENIFLCNLSPEVFASKDLENAVIQPLQILCLGLDAVLVLRAESGKEPSFRKE